MAKKINEKKQNTRKILADANVEDLAGALNNCTDIATDTKAMQDSLHAMICKIEAGKIKANLTKIKAAYAANIELMNKLGPALNQCNPANNFKTWTNEPCKGPCSWDVEEVYTMLAGFCKKALMGALGVGEAKMKKFRIDLRKLSKLYKEIKKIKEFWEKCKDTDYIPYENGIVPSCFWIKIKVDNDDKYGIKDFSMYAGVIDDLYIQGEGILHIPETVELVLKKSSKVIDRIRAQMMGECDVKTWEELDQKFDEYQKDLTGLTQEEEGILY